MEVEWGYDVTGSHKGLKIPCSYERVGSTPTIPTMKKNCEEIKLAAKIRMLKHRYGLTYEEYQAMYLKQNKRCPICEDEFELGGYKGLYVDHCHITKKVRGLLCPKCNSAIGVLKDSKRNFENAMNYLKI